MPTFRSIRIAFPVLLTILFVITACKPAEPTPTVVPTTLATEIVPPTETISPARLVLIDTSATASAELTTYLSETAAANGLTYQVIDSLEGVAFGSETRVAIFLSEPANITELAAGSPTTQFIAPGTFDPAGFDNVSLIRSKPEDLAFMAGYLTTLISWDWRSAGFLPQQTNAFENGGRYLCGQCTPYWSPFKYFPLVSSTPTQDEITNMGSFYVNTFYVDPSFAQTEVLDALTALESVAYRPITLIGYSGTAFPERFTALLGFDLLPSLQTLLPQAMNGVGGLTASTKVVITTYTDEEKISPAKKEIFNTVASDLEAGLIEPLSVP